MIYNLSCSFTGHRKIPPESHGSLRKKLYEECERLIINEGVKYFYCGGALGFDTLAANTVILLKEKYSDISLILALPCKDQAEKWNYANKYAYDYIMSYADEIMYISESYTPSCMHKRNRYLVDNALFLITYLRNDKGGTLYTRSYAQKQGSIITDL